jgi:hypothetical protein
MIAVAAGARKVSSPSLSRSDRTALRAATRGTQDRHFFHPDSPPTSLVGDLIDEGHDVSRIELFRARRFESDHGARKLPREPDQVVRICSVLVGQKACALCADTIGCPTGSRLFESKDQGIVVTQTMGT